MVGLIKNVERAVVLGLGRSGEGAARLLLAEGHRVTVLDVARAGPVLERARRLRAEGAEVWLGPEAFPDGDYDLGVVSPGIAMASPWLIELEGRGVPLVSELEFARAYARGPCVAVTGSNGKSTAVAWMRSALEMAGKDVRVAGNFEGGPALSAAVLEHPAADPWLLEVSSFQLETCSGMPVNVALILNILPNHLDRHGTMETYLRTKARLLAGAGSGDTVIIPEEWAGELSAFCGDGARIVVFGSGPECDYRRHAGAVEKKGAGVVLEESAFPFGGAVEGEWAAGVAATLDVMGVTPETIAAAAGRMRRLPHRGELAGEYGGVRFVDDSKATNLAAVRVALEREAGAVRLIAGGLFKEHDLEWVIPWLAEKVSGAYLIGDAAARMAKAWSRRVDCEVCGTLERAVLRAAEDARPGETVLLAPGCASFDQFSDYAQRGERFADIVKSLAKEMRKWERGCLGV